MSSVTVKVLCAFIISTISLSAFAEIVASCGASKGHAYYVSKGLVQPKDSGWTEDAISEGSFQLIRSGEDWDVIYTDASGGTLSARADGGVTSGFVTDDGDVVLQIIYGKSVEVYVFWLSLKAPMVSYSQAKFGSPVPKHGVLVAPCRKVAK